MALPVEISTCLMTATVLSDEGQPIESSVSFTPSRDHVISGPGDTVVELQRRSVLLDSTGFLSIRLIPSDEPDVRPQGTTWQMTVEATGTTLTFTVPLGLTTASIADYVIASPNITAPQYLIGLRGPPGPASGGFVWRGTWAVGVTYAVNDLVASGGSTFLVLLNHVSSGSAPTPDAPGTRYALWARAGDGAAGAVPTSRQIIAGTGLAGGGTLTVDRTLAVSFGSTSGTVAAGNDTRLVGGQAVGTASVRTLGTGALEAKPGDWTPTITDLPAGSVLSQVQNAGGSWPNRPTSRTDVRVIWIRIVAASSDPAAATSPSVTGAYNNDIVIGA
jgi:hypothetical protein